eukprot:CAMPEP_0182938324 /NCGR_PEP_ID=MMETSP0105_2-20130417/43643_1 /TAXON_ID=81532 ORGANISM="Acanthoeca-like sp., Strain 10tr" /NCGR_SAMPLE_ID=MMETSP0105_2 /ASSEMBLY_ACC=CAM_ASM_000205 /LENGTH=450 /DNA_ID=CAMNT_0025077611 /DNA_START=104 /DNA_END=1456 /DNA_ORIENTATION=-
MAVATLMWLRWQPLNIVHSMLSMIPSNATKVTAARVQACLKASGRLPAGVTVLSATAVPFGRDENGDSVGLLSEICRVECTYSENAPADLPDHFVAKFAPAEFGARLFGRLAMFENENMFYDLGLGGRAGVGTAQCYFCHYSLVSGEIVLFLRELSDYDARPQRVGWSAEEAKTALLTYAKLHAYYWRANETDVDVGVDLTRLMSSADRVTLGLYQWFVEKSAPKFAKTMEEHIFQNTRQFSPECVTFIEDILTPNCNVVTDSGFFSLDRPLTVVHFDARSENVYFPKNGKGGVTLIDFQHTQFARCAHDLMYNSLWNVTAILTVELELELMEHYFDALLAERPSLKGKFTLVQLGHDYVIQLIFTVYLIIVASLDALESWKKNKAVMSIFLSNMDRMLTRWNAVAVFQQSCHRVHKDAATGEVTMDPITEEERLAVLPAFYKDFVAARA